MKNKKIQLGWMKTLPRHSPARWQLRTRSATRTATVVWSWTLWRSGNPVDTFSNSHWCVDLPKPYSKTMEWPIRHVCSLWDRQLRNIDTVREWSLIKNQSLQNIMDSYLFLYSIPTVSKFNCEMFLQKLFKWVIDFSFERYWSRHQRTTKFECP